MNPVYRFLIKVGADGEQKPCSPIYGGNLALVYEMEQGQRFYRAKLNGKLTFLRGDYDTILAAPFGTVFHLTMQKATNAAGTSFSDYYKCRFTITDCTVNVDDHVLTVQPQTTDQYDEVLAGMDNEYNLISLNPSMNSVTVTKRPMVQVYVPDSDKINCYISGTSWEQDCTPENDLDELGTHYYFGLDTIFARVVIPAGSDYSGTYEGRLKRTGYDSTREYFKGTLELAVPSDYGVRLNLSCRTGYYGSQWDGRMELIRRNVFGSVALEASRPDAYVSTGGAVVSEEGAFVSQPVLLHDGDWCRFYGDADTDVAMISRTTNGGVSYTPLVFGEYEGFNAATYTANGSVYLCFSALASASTVYVYRTDILYYCNISGSFGSGAYTMTDGEEGYLAVTATINFMLARWVLDVPSVPNVTIYDLPSDDMGGDNRNYHYVARVTLGCCHISTNTSATPTEYGIANNSGTLYYAPPSAISGEKFYPINQVNWEGTTSYWFAYHSVFNYLESSGRATEKLRNAYPLWSCISALLAQFSSVTFGGTSTYSQFLYASSNPLTSETVKLFVTPKSNILAGDYSVPAQKAMTTLGKFLDMLRNVYQCYWFIDASDRLRIEHVSWFKKGGAYSGSATVGIDLTQQRVTRSLTPWAYGVNEYTYEKQDMPQRYQFEWMDDSTIPFMGNAIEILSPAVTEGKVEQVSIGDFSADIDYMMLNPSVFSQDGFALLGATGSGNAWSVPYVTLAHDGLNFTMQNGYLAMVRLQPNYWIYDLPAKHVRINGNEYTLTNVARRKQQKVTIPLGDTDPDMLKLVKTGMGNGEIRTLSVNLSSRAAEATLNYDTE